MITAKMSPWFSLVCRFSKFQVWSRIGWVQVGLGRQQGQGERVEVGRSGKQEGGGEGINEEMSGWDVMEGQDYEMRMLGQARYRWDLLRKVSGRIGSGEAY